MLFEFSNTPANLHEYIIKILAEKLDIFIIIYLDDILIYIKDFGQSHIEAVHWMLKIPQKYNLFANLKEC